MNRFPRHLRRSSRIGSAILIVLVSLIVCTGVLGAHIRSILQTRRHQTAVHQLHQGDWILRAAADRATKKLELDSDFDGEVWELQAPPRCFDKATVETVVDQSSNDSTVVRLVFKAIVDDAVVLRRTLEFAIGSDQSPVTNPMPQGTSP